MKNVIQYQIKVTIIGARQVGKSALTVRYLTRRYIGEYKSHTDLSYRQVFCIDGSSVEVEIVDVSNQPDDTSVTTTRAKNSDACVVVYSIADRTSFRAAQEALIALRADNQLETSPTNSFQDDNKETNHISSQMPMPPPPPPPFAVDTTATTNQTQTSTQTQTTPSTSILSIPVVLLANKKDLGHLRQVDTAEGRELARRYRCVFCEVSAAEPDESEPEDLAGIFNQLIREARGFKIRQQDANNNPNNNNNHHNNHNSNSNNSSSSSSNNNNNNANNSHSRQRKRSVFIINRMLGSLIGRNSMPPELPSSRKGGASQLTSSMPNVAGSFRSVFKKRSV